MHQESFSITTTGRSLSDISQSVQQVVSNSGLSLGVAHVFLRHTSASLILSENADPTVLQDLETIISRLAPDGDPAYRHNYEGDDDMAAHVRSVLTVNSVTIPFNNSRLSLGTWQGLFLWEHRYRPHTRQLIVSLQGE